MAAKQRPEPVGARFEPEAVKRFTCRLLEGFGLPPDDGRALANALLDADMSRTESHGLRLLPSYLERLVGGAINPRPDIRLETGSGAVLTFDGDDGFGQVVAQRMLDQSLERVAEYGVVAATARTSNHLGALGYFVRQAADQGMFAFLGQNTRDIVAPTGGVRAGIGNNPFAMAMPSGSDAPLVLDIACSAVARQGLVVAAKRGGPIPEGWAIDEHGDPTTDPEAALRGALLPFGGHKGFGLAVIVGALSAVMSGASYGPAVPAVTDHSRKRDLGHFLLLIDVARFGDLTDYAERMRDYGAGICSAGPEVRLPGQGSHERRRQAQETGVPIRLDVLTRLADLGAEHGIDVSVPQPRPEPP